MKPMVWAFTSLLSRGPEWSISALRVDRCVGLRAAKPPRRALINHSALNKYFNTAFGSLALGRCGAFRSILNRAWESQDEAEKAGAALRLALGVNDGALGVRALML